MIIFNIQIKINNMFTETVINNIRKIMNDSNLTQAVMASYIGISPSQFSKILSGTVQLSLNQLSNLATSLSIREIDIITYPDRYVSEDYIPSDSPEVSLQIKLKKDKRDQVMRLIFGDNDIEILNK